MTWLRYPRVLGVLACVFFLCMSALLVVAKWSDHQWSLSAARTDGRVTQLVPRPFVGSQREPRGTQVPLAPEVHYTVDGTEHTYIPAHGEMQRRYPVGSTVVVLYDRDDPDVARLEHEGRFGLTTLAALFVLLSIGVGAILVATRKITYLGPRGAARTPPAPQPVGRR